MSPTRLLSTAIALFCPCIWFPEQVSAASPKVDFNRDIRAILSDHCYACHGPDEKARKGGLRLDIKQFAFTPAKSGEIAVVPGDLSKSELVRRITTENEDDLMPPAKKGGKPLSAKQIELLKQWVAEGADWQEHWAYMKPRRMDPPKTKNKTWAKNEIDPFILNRLEQEGLEPSSEAPKEKLIRRAALDLTGLPPTVEEIDAFLADQTSEAYEKVVDRLLKSKAYGERQAMFWLDLARYGETQGYHHDNHRDMWHWRDWVIKAFNDNMRFDQFTIEQLAGDLVPKPTRDQLIATGFHRNEMTTSEGGALPEEYSVKYVVGRVDTTARVWMGTSMACAECHDHKYDPITQKDYYRFFAFFNTVPENGLDAQLNPVPRLELKTSEHEQRLAQFNSEIAALELAHRKIVEETNATWTAGQEQWAKRHREKSIENWGPLLALDLGSKNGAKLSASADNAIAVSGAHPDRDTYQLRLFTPAKAISGVRLEALPDASLAHGKAGRSDNGEFILTRVEMTARSANPEKARANLQNLELSQWRRLGPFTGSSKKEAFEKDFGPERGVDLKAVYQEGQVKWEEANEAKDGEVVALPGTDVSFYFFRTIRAPVAQRVELRLGSGGSLKVWVNGKLVHNKDVNRSAAADQDKVQVRLASGENKLLVKVTNASEKGGFYFRLGPEPILEHAVAIAAAAADASRGGYPVSGTLDELIETGWSIDTGNNDAAKQPHYAWFRFADTVGFAEGMELEIRLIFDAPVPHKTLARFRLAMTSSDDLPAFFSLPDHIRSLLLVDGPRRTPAQNLELQRYYREQFVPEAKDLVKVLNDKRAERQKHQDSIPIAMVMQEMEKPRATHLLVRGEYNHPGEVVAPGVPEAILRWADGLPKNRLGLAKWLLHADHPLTSRVVVNQLWQQHFGAGLVKTSEDFGAQGERPSHPDLLDWLATELVRSGWDMKHIHRLIVTSAAYRQEATTSPAHQQKDPGNRWLAHFPRQRLEDEVIRDLAMAVSGLLNPQTGGPSIFPYQPPGLWEQVAFEGTRTWEQNLSKGADNYRRGLYVYWRRSIPYASFVTFDAPSRETCTVRRPRTNTPLQALVVMNDPVYVEAARSFGQRIMQQGGTTVADRVKYAFRVCLGRNPTTAELDRLTKAFETEFEHFLKHRADANQLVHAGATPPPANVDVIELAAWTLISQVLLNLDETITKG
ncbi:MAG: PSD1 domain-containing protein [Verrucomicrobia bacterium]|nr:PSD1 domain-containing protein [Verrucomicrobiota bacterium]